MQREEYVPPSMQLRHCFPPPTYGPSLRLNVVPGPAGGMWLRAERRDDWGAPGEWWSIGWEGRLSPDDVVSAADWFFAVAGRDVMPGDPHVWLGSPAVAFGLVGRSDDGMCLAIDACFMLDAAAPWPRFGIDGIVEDDFYDDRHYYMTVDLSLEDAAEAAATWAGWADHYGRTPVVCD
jgi:hypothetical protein